MFRAFYAYVLQERYQVVRGTPISALSIGDNVNVIQFLKCARARRVHRAYDGPSEMRQALKNIDTLGRGEPIQSTGKKDFLLWHFCDAS